MSEHTPPQSTQVIVVGIGTVRPYAERDRNRHTEHMRVVAGELGGRKLVSPDGDDTRPTSDRVREAIFNSLFSLDAIDEARVLDAFAGSGALGIEALSRGASHATFVETGRAALAALRENIETLRLGPDSQVVPGDALAHLERSAATGSGYDLVLLDPPYGFDGWAALLALMPEGAVVVIESDRAVEVPDSWVVHRVKQYGSTVVTLATATSTPGAV
ncbi:MAG: 16S rRNA (guanine(966)-N(2))-methyltransferase RsmD [Actinomycetota bacterium]